MLTLKNRYLKRIILLLSIVLALLIALIITMAVDGDSDPKPKATFKATTPEGKLREISDHVRQ